MFTRWLASPLVRCSSLPDPVVKDCLSSQRFLPLKSSLGLIAIARPQKHPQNGGWGGGGVGGVFGGLRTNLKLFRRFPRVEGRTSKSSRLLQPEEKDAWIEPDRIPALQQLTAVAAFVASKRRLSGAAFCQTKLVLKYEGPYLLRGPVETLCGNGPFEKAVLEFSFFKLLCLTCPPHHL